MASFASMLANLKAANSPSTQNFPPPSFKPDDPMITRTSSLNSVNILRSGRKNATPAPAPAPAPATATAPASTPSNIAICATIVDNFPHSDIWQKWAQSTNPSKYTASLHLHPKNPDNIQNSYLKSICIDSSIQPDWNDVRIVQAMLLLIKKALENPNTRFLILCTESCLPITNLADCAEKLTKTNKSWLRHYDKNSATSKFDELQCFGPLEKYIPSNVISKALPGWICLRRDHAEAILGLPKNLEAELFPVFKGVWAPEEMFFPTALNLAGCLNDEEVENRMVIFAEWDRHAKGSDKAHPVTFDSDATGGLCVENVERWREGGSLFARKFKYYVGLRNWESVIGEVDGRRGGGEGNSNLKKRKR